MVVADTTGSFRQCVKQHAALAENMQLQCVSTAGCAAQDCTGSGCGATAMFPV
jgi:hypothetical protein